MTAALAVVSWAAVKDGFVGHLDGELVIPCSRNGVSSRRCDGGLFLLCAFWQRRIFGDPAEQRLARLHLKRFSVSCDIKILRKIIIRV